MIGSAGFRSAAASSVLAPERAIAFVPYNSADVVLCHHCTLSQVHALFKLQLFRLTEYSIVFFTE